MNNYWVQNIKNWVFFSLFSELMAAQQKHKQLLKSYMKSERPLEDTEIGRIDRLLRKVMYKRFLMRKF